MLEVRLCFARHARSEANAEGWFSGHVDVDLTDQGRAQALALAASLAHVPLTRVVSSDLKRALRTAAPAAAHHGLDVDAVRALRERDMGAFTGLPTANPPAALRAVLDDPCLRPPGGEALAQVAHRALVWLCDQPWEGQGLVVSHGGLLRVVLGLLEDLPDAALPHRAVNNAEPTRLSWDVARALRARDRAARLAAAAREAGS